MADEVEAKKSKGSQSESSGDQAPNTSESKDQDSGLSPAQPEKKPSKLKQVWQKAGLDVMTLSLMLKGSLAPTIAIAMYQSDAVAKQYGTLGYLVAIMSILGFSIMPRGRLPKLVLTATGND